MLNSALLCILIQTVFRGDSYPRLHIHRYCFAQSMPLRLASLKLMRFLFFSYFTNKKVALNGGCAGKDGRQTADKPPQQRVCVMESVPRIQVRSAFVKDVNGYLQIS